MPYADPEQRRRAKRESERRRRARMGQSATGRRGVVRVLPRPDAPPATLERQAEHALTAAGILEILGHEVDAVRADPLAGRLAKAKVIAQLAGVALRAVEIAGVEQRIDELEQRTAFMPGRPG